jgi:hypothetical protein
LFQRIKNNKTLFWFLNLSQSFLFCLIHTLVTDAVIAKIAIGLYVFTISVYFGWLNNKFNSILPSWMIHWMNGIQTLLFAYGFI